MKTEQQARVLMMRRHQSIKNRQISLLNRSSAEIGIDLDSGSSNTDQGKYSK